MTASARTYLLLGLGMATFGSGTPISREVTGAFPVFVASFARMVLAAALLVPLMLLARRESSGWERVVPRIDRFDWARIVGIALAGMNRDGDDSGPRLRRPRADWAALAWWGLGTMAVGSVLWYSGVSRAPGTTASAFMGVIPVSALLLSYLLLGEAFRWIHLVGMVAVLVGIAAVTQSGRALEEDGSPS